MSSTSFRWGLPCQRRNEVEDTSACFCTLQCGRWSIMPVVRKKRAKTLSGKYQKQLCQDNDRSNHSRIFSAGDHSRKFILPTSLGKTARTLKRERQTVLNSIISPKCFSGQPCWKGRKMNLYFSDSLRSFNLRLSLDNFVHFTYYIVCVITDR